MIEKNCIGGASPLTRGKRRARGPRRRRTGRIPAHAGKTAVLRALRPGRGAHPRSRGENGLATLARSLSCGASPLTRGKPATTARESGRRGRIPAHAGKTHCRGLMRSAPTAHPRSRGENCCAALIAASVRGASPLTRGKPGPEQSLVQTPGRIPAHAGKTPPPRPGRRAWPAHPRSRGENGEIGGSLCAHQGASPLTRGKRGEALPQRLDDGRIPAHAGKTGIVRKR